ncbi:hypothetical protein G6F70_000113 [Rhizopus microsporus]|uniref:Uncharacterized protein n=1 Tax=Rhizopus microsporus TaxID=58291 RepID=A0A1X0SF82_RHIZD|nr:hypothetical protein G6F71_001865 [Rhizopus microsporus]KAG1204807.1 hypothetical protein G6F70_000113 [Rhizopus microsporus]KAG1216281.1 hypothetical protein G6F69_000199 [Rhizopus microsporus]KAG1236211.1 hypothetical protein G6F67_002181 [Rhizopus microsporus]KAG1265058.1 hypothetical protein G6F68_003903 [Rhizopus microsporus]
MLTDNEIAQQQNIYPLKVCSHCSVGNRISEIEMSFTLCINLYKPIPQSIEVPISQMQEVVDIFPETYAVKWNVGKLYKSKSQGEDQEATGFDANGNPIKKRKRYISQVQYILLLSKV